MHLIWNYIIEKESEGVLGILHCTPKQKWGFQIVFLSFYISST